MDLNLTRLTTVSVDADAGQCVSVIYGFRENERLVQRTVSVRCAGV